MAVRHGYGKIAGADALVFAYDTGDTRNSYRGEPTENLLSNVDDWSSGWTGNLFSNWINATVTANAGVAPDGTMTASKLTGGYSRWQRINCSTSTTYTFSFWIKNIDLPIAPRIHIAFGLNGSLVNYNNTTTIDLNTIGEWTKVSKTHTSPSSGINQMEVGVEWSSNYPNSNSVLVWHAMCEQKAHATPFVNGTRSATQGLLDLTGNETIDLSRTSFDSNADLDFDGTDDEIQIISSNWAQPGEDITVEAMVYREGYSESSGQYSSIINASNDATGIYSFSFYVSPTSNRLAGWLHSGTHSNSFDSGYVIQFNTWYHVAFTLENGDPHTVKTFVNGVEQSSSTMGSGVRFANITKTTIGAYVDRNQYEWNGKIPIVKIYNRALTPAEVKNNFNNYKGRFNL